MASYDEYKIAEKWMGIWVRKGPGKSYDIKGIIYGSDNKTYKALEKKGYYINLEGVGWCCERDTNDLVVLKKVKSKSNKKVGKDDIEKLTEVDEESYAVIPGTSIIGIENENPDKEFQSDLDNNLFISNLRSVFGMPYQFMPIIDPRLNGSEDLGSIGRKYAREIVSNLPLLLIVPGKPVFMGAYNKKDRESVLKAFINVASGHESELKDTVFSDKFGKYYSLEYAYKDYFEYVNPMCRTAARIMQLHNTKIDGVKLDEINWAYTTNEKFKNLFSVYRGCTAWYCESETQISEGYSNNTTESALASKINSLSDYGRELQFLLGTAKSYTGIALDKFTNSENLTNMENTSNFINNILGNSKLSGIFGSIVNSAQTVIAGGKLVFPKIWEGSSFNRSYDINLKLVSPDGDDLSVYLNIIVPMLHLLGLTLPRETSTGHGYISPFLVRAYYKGLFNVDMGIITDLRFSKGQDSAWTSSGVPTIVEVSLSIEDLYSEMYITNMDGIKYNMLNNIILMDYIANLCGVNINEMDINRAIDLYFTQNIKNRITDTWHLKIWGSLDQYVTNRWQKIFSKFYW